MLTNNRINNFKEVCKDLLSKPLPAISLGDIQKEISSVKKALNETSDKIEITDLENLLNELNEKEKEIRSE